MDNTAFRLRKPKPFSLRETFVHLKDLGQATGVTAESGFWNALEARPELQVGRMVGAIPMERDMPVWEMHPSGDELLVILSGAFDLVLQDRSGDQIIALEAGHSFLVPFGVWHRLHVRSPGEILFVAPGKGTEQRVL